VTEPVGERREDQIADHQAGQRRGEDGSQHFARKIPFLDHQRRYVTDRLRVVTVEKHHKPAQGDDQILKCTDFLVVDDIGHVDRLGDHGFLHVETAEISHDS
jgi:hypothetical protein